MNLAIVISTHNTDFSALAFKSDFLDSIEKASLLGYDGVELAIRNPSDVNFSEILSLVEKKHLKIVALGTGQAYLEDRLSFVHRDKEIRDKAIERIFDHINLAERFGAMVIVGLLRGKVKKGQNRDFCYNVMKDCFKKCLDVAEKKKVTILIEPLNRYETNLINSCKEAVEFIDELKSHQLKILIDSFHMNIEEASIEKTIKEYAKHIGHVHVADSNRWAPGLGHIDFKKIVKVLNDIDYKGYLSAEIIPMPNPEFAAKQTIDCLQPLVG